MTREPYRKPMTGQAPSRNCINRPQWRPVFQNHSRHDPRRTERGRASRYSSYTTHRAHGSIRASGLLRTLASWAAGSSVTVRFCRGGYWSHSVSQDWRGETGRGEKALFDYPYLLKACEAVNTPYVLMLEDDVFAMDWWFHRTREALSSAEKQTDDIGASECEFVSSYLWN